jgi:hypothetical protein
MANDDHKADLSWAQLSGAHLRKANLRRAYLLSRLLLEIDVGERLPVGVADDEAPPMQLGVGLVEGPRRREAALGQPS